MKKTNIVRRSAVLASISIFLSALTRLLDINNILVAVHTGDINSSVATSIITDWELTSLLLTLTGIWLLFLSRDLKNGSRKAWIQALLIGIALCIFSASAWLRYPTSLRLAYFFFVGLLLIIPLLLYNSHFRSDASK